MKLIFSQWRRTFDLRKALIPVTPECRTPPAVQILNHTIFLFQPLPELLLTKRTMTFSTKFIGDMPQNHTRMLSELFSQPAVDLCHFFSVYRWGITVIMSSTEQILLPLFIHTQYFRVLIRKPFRSCTGRCGQNCRNSLCVKWINHFFEPVKLIISLFRLQHRPGEHSYRYRINLCLFKILNVLFQYIRAVQPLLRVVVSAM